jgi:hypothetical protein
VDEAGEGWTEKQILFLLSRMRTAGCSIHPQLIMTANPDGASFLKKWVDYCLDENGVPKEGTENIIRWFVVLDSVVLWGDSPQELFEKHGKERGMVLATDIYRLNNRLCFTKTSLKPGPTEKQDQKEKCELKGRNIL